jgi:hypothetical protein
MIIDTTKSITENKMKKCRNSRSVVDAVQLLCVAHKVFAKATYDSLLKFVQTLDKTKNNFEIFSIECRNLDESQLELFRD